MSAHTEDSQLNPTSLDDVSDSEAPKQLVNRVKRAKKSRSCPYLGTVNRHLLDFDFEKVCSITTVKEHVYGCLVCGKYYEGRGKDTKAFAHALTEEHLLFIDLKSGRTYCLPDNYEVDDASLDDIKYYLHPTFTRADVKTIKTNVIHAKALDGSDFIPGLVGLNSVNNCTDYANVIIHLICAIAPLRNFFLLLDCRNKQKPDPVVTATADLMKKIFNPRNFKGIVSPHEFLQACNIASNKEFTLMKGSNAFVFFSWVLNHLHLKLRRERQSPEVKKLESRVQPSIVNDTLSGIVQIWSSVTRANEERPFFSLTLDMPAAPVFKSDFDDTILPEVHIFDLLDKFGGQTLNVGNGRIQRLSLLHLPPFLVIHLKRFAKNSFFLEKNPTIVKFPTKDLDLADYVDSDHLSKNPCTTYDLVGNVVHVGDPNKGTYKVHILHEVSDDHPIQFNTDQKTLILFQPTGEWYEIEDLRVTPVMAHQVAISASFIQLYRRQDVTD